MHPPPAPSLPSPPLPPLPLALPSCLQRPLRDRAEAGARRAAEAAPLRNAAGEGWLSWGGRPEPEARPSRWGGRGHVQDVLQGEHRGLREGVPGGARDLRRQSPHAATAQPPQRSPQGGVGAALGAGGGPEEATRLGCLLWFVVWFVWALLEKAFDTYGCRSGEPGRRAKGRRGLSPG